MKALIIGATGATGKDLVNVLLQDAYYTQVLVFVRRSTGIVHSKLQEVITDFDKLEQVSEFINGDVWFSLLGTTLKAAGSKEKQQHIDYAIPANFAAVAKRNGIPQTVLLSAYGAAAGSNVFYSKIKGELEDTIDSLAFNSYIIFRPGLLLRKDTDRIGERIFGNVLKFLNGVRLIKKFKPMPTLTLAEKMAKAPKVFATGKHVIELEKIFAL
ncbi:MAG: NAD(P)H-binding protein [Bacteroidota bacterium]